MTDTLRAKIEAWDGDAVVVSYDRPTGTWIFIALHDTSMASSIGGSRMKTYPTPADGLEDALRLGQGMTFKWAGVGIPFGGAKGVMAIPGRLDDETRDGLLRRYGRLVQSLEGRFRTGVDLGTTPEDLLTVAETCDYVVGVVDGRSEDPGPFTALGVFVGIRAAIAHRFADDRVAGHSVLIQGVGDVGLPLAEMLVEAGATVLLSDIDEDVASRAAARLGARVVDADEVYATEVDVYAPCAVGATVNPDTIPLLRCAIVAGSANNQLLTPDDAAALHERGILYAPDYIINAGGAVAFAGIYEGIDDVDELNGRVEMIEGSLARIFDEAEAADESPLAAARRVAEQFLATAGGDAGA
ncbi:MAG: Glu/Leu/Phe/Val dehydrogenase dimerization domain-containing protein [Gemmatimonadota bacterium]|nr:Glu/Leu/Phe/Val dehydrogenase dimerization domain-containing protein [Gemmatimonadota bacterium]